MKKILISAIFLVAFLVSSYYFIFLKPNNNPPSVAIGKMSLSPAQTHEEIETISENLEVPWDMVFLPNNSMLISERPGRVQLISNGSITQIANIQDVKTTGESGLHGIAIDPDFEKNQFVYLYYTYSSDGSNTLNKVNRYKLENSNLTFDRVIVDKIPGAIFHDGGRIRFGPDNLLYITTGDAREPSLAQDKNSLAGKILRVTRDGGIPSDNPFVAKAPQGKSTGDPRVYSYGHRNPQGIVWDDSGQLWATEHGNSTHDEVNKITKGGNYGWPTIQGTETRPGMITPVIESGSGTWAPASIALLNGKMYFAGLRGTALYAFDPKNPVSTFETLYDNEWGRIRGVVSHDGGLYISTSNRDGRGTPGATDDRIIRLDQEALN